MAATQLLAEYLIIGFLALLGFAELNNLTFGFNLPSLFGLEGAIVTGAIISVAYMIGFFINVIAEVLFHPFYALVERNWMTREGNPALVLDYIRYDLYINGPVEIIKRMDYHRSLIRISRSIAFLAIFLTLFAFVRQATTFSIFYLFVAIFSVFAFHKRVEWFTRTVYFSWLAQKKNGKHKVIQASGESFPLPIKNDCPTRVVVFAGGTGFREINITLSKSTKDINRIVPVWDNGGSSKILRLHYPVMPVGDVRHALMTMAHGEGRVGSIVRLFNWRLRDAGSDQELRDEFKEFTSGVHSLIQQIDPSLRDLILIYLRAFEATIPTNMDLRRGSIGNFVLVGAFLSHENDMNAAIHVFRQICSINGRVWPVSLMPNIHIGARLDDNEIIVGQELVTTLDRNKFRHKIDEVFFTSDLSDKKMPQRPISVSANHQVIEALEQADVVIYGPGSFFTSVLPHLVVSGVVDAIASLDVPKLMIANIAEDSETYDYTIAELVEKFIKTADCFASKKRAPYKYITHIAVNDNNHEIFIPGSTQRYLPFGKNVTRYARSGINIVTLNLENVWNRGRHDPTIVAKLIIDIANGDATSVPSQ